jgi:REP element-mobilizing transposase RayT
MDRPRQLRLEYAGAIYHVMSRGNRREGILKDDEDRERFLATLAETCQKTGWVVHAYCLMGNPFHLVVETPQPNLVAGMKWLLGTYTVRFNRRHRLTGHLFSGRYKSLISPDGLRLRAFKSSACQVADCGAAPQANIPGAAGLTQRGASDVQFGRSVFHSCSRVFLLNVFAKNEKIDLSAAERNMLKKTLGQLVQVYKGRS